MIIDMHAHVFPDKIARGAVDKLAERSALEPHTNGTVSVTEQKMKEFGVDKFVALNIAVKPTQNKTVNHFAIQLLSNETVIPFGSVHPYSADWEEELERLKNSGLKGIKLHPDYQLFFANEEKALQVYRKCAQLGLMVQMHCGVDIGLPPPVHAVPSMLREAVEKCPDTTFCFAHLGGWQLWDEVEKQIAGLPVYMDTSFISRYIQREQFLRILERHGADRILLGSDCPWEKTSDSIAFIRSFDFSKEIERKILGGNAEKLLGLE